MLTIEILFIQLMMSFFPIGERIAYRNFYEGYLGYIQKQLYYLNHDACYQTFFIFLQTCLYIL